MGPGFRRGDGFGHDPDALRERALSEAADRFRARRQNSAEAHAAACEVMPGGNTRSVLYHAPFPLRFARGEGAWLTDVDGHRYLDLLGEYSAGIFGHSHPRIRQAVADALDGLGLNLGGHTRVEERFARAVCARFRLDLVRFTNSGTEANMMALAAARAFTGRERILVFAGGYHGGTLNFPDRAGPANAPFDAVIAPYNDAAATRQLLDREGDRLAAVLVEPMMGSAGCIPADAEFLAMLRAETRRHGILLVFDEVMTSRLDREGLSGKLCIEPDLKTLGKYLGGGMSCGAFGGRADVMLLFDPARGDALPHAGTFNNNTLTMTVGHAGLTEVFTPQACNALNARGERLRENLNRLFLSYQAPMQATGIGSLLAVHPRAGEIRNPKDAANADPRLRDLLFLDLLEQGFYLARRGFIALSLMVADEECDRFVDAIERFIVERRALLANRQ